MVDAINNGVAAAKLNGDNTAMNLPEKEAFDRLIRPTDSYTENGTYWADLPIGERVKFVSAVNKAETNRELGNLWQMIKDDPLSPIGFYFREYVVPGAGLGLEGYVLFSIGNISPLFDDVFKACWKEGTTCNLNWIAAITYLEIIGIIFGQIMVGIIGDWIGRRWGLIQDATIMFLGLIMLVAAWGVTENGWVICYAWSLWFYSIGVGGEYPMTVTIGMENGAGSGSVTTREDRLHRGRKVTLAFLMQGWGQVFNQAVLMILLIIFHHGSISAPYSAVAVQWTYRISFALPAVGTLWLIYYRAYHMKAASKQLAIIKKRSHVTGYDTESLRLTLKYFGPRLLATAGCWFFNDVFVYGSKLFQSEFIDILLPNETGIFPTWEYNLLNASVSLAGYYLAAFFVDHKLYGRKWMQIIGFLAVFITYVIPAFNYTYYTEAAHVHSFQAMYFLGSFFTQFGPNCITFLVAGEVFPTPIRATAHGISAASGKLGALWVAILYNYIGVEERFKIVPWFGLAGLLLTYLFLPDTTGLDLKEQERRWEYIRSGREAEYHGPAIHSKHLSVWERFRGVGKNYNAEIDYQQKVEEMRSTWEAAMIEKTQDESGTAVDTDEELHEGQVHEYFRRTSPMFGGAEKTLPREEGFSLPPAAEE
ncbi:hypothetical protein ASPZODRAFT_128708 [Penicilliopsis zonata CBS 506.65]|uniref:Major facilitator superfamily (MFS) profile domain-containing protein n=1 Tax=Penicilliopsis zonata CBS 506.65 TaxID=1073090 RepID=A0A1L9SSL4_9EURO|nr:hypothetical protein ASPZODRAFT_128708 [Penicilliopsis zonata CBS 506.65]OJJ50101.1 hypothetical protein ASPZODRAFT_128708 [Penicilliopsis zonata CBS 506.65]